jgi:GT2 family glycosyltransferase
MLLKALAALHAVSDIERDEIFVVDNASTDGSPEQVTAAFPHVHLIRNPCNNGFARANNQAIAAATGEFMLLVNNDAFLESDALERFEKVFRTHARAAVVAGQLLDSEGRLQRSAGYIPTAIDELGLRFLRRRPRAPKIDGLTEVESVVGACMAIRASAIRDAGSLDGDFFFYYEETEWCHRLRARGWRVYVEPAVRVTHLKGASTRGLKRRGAQIEMLRSRLLFYRKTMSGPVAALLVLNRLARLLLNTVTNLLATMLTLGLYPRLREKLFIYLLQLAWLLRGCPEHWGLPDKCLRKNTVHSS